MFFAELQERLSPIRSVPWTQGKIGLVQRYAMLSGFATLSVMALLRFLVSDSAATRRPPLTTPDGRRQGEEEAPE